ncbi:hypothetical protein FQN60_004320 [Etheostoma spectabile]|uniref:Cysteine protease n=1 Tax=Etheostoma spectabile TaxID=54343 RepID=A0A5J5CY62_9PERO|nr:hypothetical protein FQN60_004320 [Etheostoma spectabile]
MNPDASSAGSEGPSPTDDLMDDWLFLSSDSANPPGPAVSRQDLETEDRGQLKSKFISAWNSVKYGRFHSSLSLTVSNHNRSYLKTLYRVEERERFRRSFASLLWLTYRRGFPQLAGCSLTSDSGWVYLEDVKGLCERPPPSPGGPSSSWSPCDSEDRISIPPTSPVSKSS